MSDLFTESTKISFGQNIKNSLSGVIFGLILFLLSFVILWWNEGNNVAQIYKANYMAKNAIEVSAEQINRENDNKLIHVSGKATTDATLTDNIITIPNAFVLKRTVEMYQWQENVQTESKDELGGGTTETKTYSYEKVWSEDAINSEDFEKAGYNNPKFPIQSEDFYAEKGKLGEFNLTSRQTNAMNDCIEYTNLPQKWEYKINNGMYYKGSNPDSPNIGDIRISYEYVPSGINISIIGQQKANDTITNMELKNSFAYLQTDGLKTKDEMINSFRKGNKFFTNLIRFVGWLLMFIGLNMLINPLVVLFKIVPFASRLVGFLTSGIMFLVSLILSLLTIAIAWFAYRPMLSIGLLVAICGIIYLIKTKYKQAEQKTLTNGL